AARSGALGYQIPTVGAYTRELDEEVETLVRRFPAIWVVFAGEGPAQRRGNGWNHPITFALVAAAQSRRNEAAARRGQGAGRPGAYQLLADCRALLAGQSLGLDVDPLQPGRVKLLASKWTRQVGAVVYGLELSTAYGGPAMSDAEAATLGDFTRFVGAWDVPAHGGVDLPTDDPPAGGDALADFNPQGA
ncbi:phage protein Gp37, partial [Roseospirillum parvum]